MAKLILSNLTIIKSINTRAYGPIQRCLPLNLFGDTEVPNKLVEFSGQTWFDIFLFRSVWME